MTAAIPVYQQRPQTKWEMVKYRRLGFSSEGVVSYCEALRSLYVNGRVEFAAFEAIDRNDFLSAYFYDHGGTLTPLDHLLTTEVLSDAFAHGNVFRENLRNPSIKISEKGGCEFEGLLADVLLAGGAYRNWEKSVDDAKVLAADCVRGMHAVAPTLAWLPYHIKGAWSSYFDDVAWDHTFIVKYVYDARWFVICATDTD